MTGWIEGFNRRAVDPPAWMRFVFLAVVVAAALGLASRRGWYVGAIAALVYGLIAIPMVVSPRSVADWSRRHPVLDGSVLGPLVFLALAYITQWPLWVCFIIAAAATGIGALRGLHRDRHRLRQ